MSTRLYLIEQKLNKGVYVIDLFKKTFPYVSENLEKWYGTSAQQIRQKDLEVYMENTLLI